MPSQKQRILEILKLSYPNAVICRVFDREYLFHKLASRCSDLRKEGYKIEYIPSDTDSVMDASYRLIPEPSGFSIMVNASGHETCPERGGEVKPEDVGSIPTSHKFELDESGQYKFA